jgi:S1-C subfamily serine protease
VDQVQAGGVAEKAGVKPGDVILSMAGTTLPRGGTRDELRKLLAGKVKPGTAVELGVLRGGARATLQATWAE